jgi:hypothetical protein
METLRFLAQTLVALITGVSPIVVELIRNRRPAAQPAAGGDGAPPPPVGASPGAAARPRPRAGYDLIDLSVLLVCSAIFSALLTDALLISGKVPALGQGVLFQIGLITLATTGALVAS